MALLSLIFLMLFFNRTISLEFLEGHIVGIGRIDA